MKKMKWFTCLTLGIGVTLATGTGCSSASSDADDGSGTGSGTTGPGGTGTDSGEPLDEGDAEWDKPPLDPPGGEGEPGDGGGDGDGDGGGDPGDDGGTGTGGGTDTGGGYPCEDYTGVCDEHTNVCEPPPDYTAPPPPCCDDVDCGCDANDMCVELPCVAEGVCDCKCHPGDDPDCAPGDCDGTGTVTGTDTGTTGGHVARAECPEEHDPVVLYMSNDDSNSQGSPVVARRTINDGGIVWPNDVRIHEFLNYYDMSYENPADIPAEVGIQMRRTDAVTGEFTLLLFAQGRHITTAARRPINLVFSLDTSGSMSGEPMDLLKDTMHAVAGSLRDGDIVSIVAWNDMQEVLLDGHSVTGADDPVLLDAINGLESGGSTNLYAGLDLAYTIAREGFSEDRINRVMMISDGGANVGVTEAELIGENAEDSNGEGIYMIGVGVAGGSYHDDLMDAVTDAGKGAYVFIDGPAEADRMFGEHFLANVEVAARDVRMELTMPWYFASP
jgi:Ca-activated chloride channel family protein